MSGELPPSLFLAYTVSGSCKAAAFAAAFTSESDFDVDADAAASDVDRRRAQPEASRSILRRRG